MRVEGTTAAPARSAQVGDSTEVVGRRIGALLIDSVIFVVAFVVGSHGQVLMQEEA